MGRLVAFELEDFFDRYEHDRSYINLASSDSLPWTLAEVRARIKSVTAKIRRLTLGYPDAKPLIKVLRKFCGVDSSLDVLPTSGAAAALFLALQELITDQDRRLRIAIPRPSYGAFEGLAHLLSADIAYYEYRPEHGWTVDENRLLKLAEECQIVVLNNPHNPTGIQVSEDLVERLTATIANSKGTLILDEVFRLAHPVHRSDPNVIRIGSLSKMYGSPGLRLGWVIADSARIRRIRTLQQYAELSASAFTVVLGTLVLPHGDRLNREKLLRRNRGVLKRWAQRHVGVIRITPPDAGTTVCLEVEDSQDEDQLFQLFLDRKVLLVPGKRCFGFGQSAWFRLGYGATTTDEFREGLRRIERVVLRRASR